MPSLALHPPPPSCLMNQVWTIFKELSWGGSPGWQIQIKSKAWQCRVSCNKKNLSKLSALFHTPILPHEPFPRNVFKMMWGHQGNWDWKWGLALCCCFGYGTDHKPSTCFCCSGRHTPALCWILWPIMIDFIKNGPFVKIKTHSELAFLRYLFTHLTVVSLLWI